MNCYTGISSHVKTPFYIYKSGRNPTAELDFLLLQHFPIQLVQIYYFRDAI